MRGLSCFVVALVAVLGCKSNAAKEAAPAGSGSAALAPPVTPAVAPPITPPSGAAPRLEWKDADGELLLSISDGKTLTGPCGLTGTLTPTEVELAGKKEPWNLIVRDGRNFSVPKLDWVIEVAPNGEVTHKRGGGKTPLGVVTGATDDAALTWFAAFIVAAPMVQHTLALQAGATRLELGGAADLRSWAVTSGATRLATRQREDPAPLLVATDKPAWDPAKVIVTPDAAQGADKIYVVSVQRDDAAMKAAFSEDKLVVREKPDGSLLLENAKARPIALGKLEGRVACAAHDRGVAALVWAVLASPVGHAAVLGSTKQ